jgi:hypothetical protein
MANTLAPAAINHVMEGSAKAWAIFNGSSTASLDDSFNVSTLTDNGTGIYQLAWSSAFSNANYSSSGFCRASTVGDCVAVFQRSSDNWTASVLGVCSARGDNNFIDSTRIGIDAHGDLA